MELLLNATWLIVVGVAGVWLLRTDWRMRSRRQFWLRVVAFVCAAFILFPVISASDDLHPEAYLAEDVRSTKRLSAVVAHPAPVTPLRWFALSLVALLLALVRRSRWVISHPPALTYRAPLVARVLCGRAPPAALAVQSPLAAWSSRRFALVR